MYTTILHYPTVQTIIYTCTQLYILIHPNKKIYQRNSENSQYSYSFHFIGENLILKLLISYVFIFKICMIEMSGEPFFIFNIEIVMMLWTCDNTKWKEHLF